MLSEDLRRDLRNRSKRMRKKTKKKLKEQRKINLLNIFTKLLLIERKKVMTIVSLLEKE